MIDVALVRIEAGKGGDGKVSFRREKFVPKGGPDGGDGGHGGSVYFVADNNLRTLDSFTSKPFLKADDGGAGSKRKCHGARAEDLFVPVPPGTQVYKLESSQENPSKAKALRLLKQLKLEGLDSASLITQKHTYKLSRWVDITNLDQPHLMAKGGTGGLGNTAFKNSRNQAPETAQPGTPGERYELLLELKLLADVGLIGLPNAGKSTLLSVLTSAKPKIANYAFTTLEPNLGIIKLAESVGSDDQLSNRTEVVVADIPGLIEGASVGKGLGDEFLRHIERCHLLVHVLSPQDYLIDQSDALFAQLMNDYHTIRQELGDYSPQMLTKPELLVLNKIDLLSPDVLHQLSGKFEATLKQTPIFISAATNQGAETVRARLLEQLRHSHQSD